MGKLFKRPVWSGGVKVWCEWHLDRKGNELLSVFITGDITAQFIVRQFWDLVEDADGEPYDYTVLALGDGTLLSIFLSVKGCSEGSSVWRIEPLVSGSVVHREEGDTVAIDGDSDTVYVAGPVPWAVLDGLGKGGGWVINSPKHGLMLSASRVPL